MARHSRKTQRRSSAYRYQGRHRAVTPKSNLRRRTLTAMAMSLIMALYPVAAGDDEGRLPLFNGFTPSLRQPSAYAGEVTTEDHHDDSDSDSNVLDVEADVNLPVDD